MLNESSFDIFDASESKLYIYIYITNILGDEIKIDGYVSYHLDRNRRCGSVLFYVNDQLESQLLKRLTDSKYESICIKVCLDKKLLTYFPFCGLQAIIYGSDLESTDNLCAYLKQCDPREKEVFICSDFNRNMMSRMQYHPKLNSSLYLFNNSLRNLLVSFNLVAHCLI